MKSNLLLIASALSVLGTLWSSSVTASTTGDVLPLVEQGAPGAKLVVIADKTSEFLLNRSADLIAGTVSDWSGATLPRAAVNRSDQPLPTGSSIVLTTLDALKRVAPELSSTQEFAKAAEINEQGFIYVPRTTKNGQQLFVVSQTARGVFNGATYLRDFCIDGTKQNLTCRFESIVRSPQMGGRGVYTLTIWKNEDQYTPADWETIFERFARDGMDRIYFWVSGHFPSEKFPQSYRSKTVENGKTYDTTVNTKIGSVADLKKIIDSAHKFGMKIYLGGGLGCWCGTIHLTNGAPGTMKIGNKEGSLCPSSPESRRALVEYYQELFAALPEADGLFIESADEVGDCDCEACIKSLDAFGSKQFGQAQLSLCEEIMDAVWRDHPHARLAYTIGYPEHVKDVEYYKRIQRLSKDPRFEWMEARNSWTFPGPKGELQTAEYVSGQVMRWKEYHRIPLGEFVAETNRAHDEGWYGMLTTFSPGFGSGSFYNDIPYPTEILPYAVNAFVFREATWDPKLSAEAMLDLTQKRFFGNDAPKHLAADIWKLREIIRTRKGLNEVDEIEKHIQDARPTAGPKTAQGLDLMARATEDIRKYLTKKRAAK